MSRKMKKLIKDIKSRQVVMGTIILALIMIISVTTTMIVPEKMQAVAQETQFTLMYEIQSTIGQYNDSIMITINHGMVNQTLTNFTILVSNTSTDFKTTANGGKVSQSDGGDIAFFNSVKDTQLKHEIEYYNGTTGTINAWVKIPSLSASVGTIIYMYYGNLSITNQEDPINAWDSNYYVVMHFNDATGTVVTDTKYNRNHSTLKGTGWNTNGITGGCYTFDNTDADKGMNGSAFDLDNLTLEMWACGSGYDSIQNIFGFREDDIDDIDCAKVYTDGLTLAGYYRTDAATKTLSNTSFYNQNGTWTYITTRRDGIDVGMWTDGDKSSYYSNTTVGTGNIAGATGGSCIGGRYWAANEPFNGSIDEIRVSTISRNESWLNTTYMTIRFPDSFITIGDDASTFTLVGVSSPYSITWAGTAGTFVYCNSTGTADEWMEINMSINTTDNVTEIRVYVADMNDTNDWINATNITLYVSSDNSSYGSLGTFTDGGSNISINTSTWPGGAGTNPFTYGGGVGLKNTNTSIWCIFKLAIPSDAITDNFYSLTSNAWKVYFGYYS